MSLPRWAISLFLLFHLLAAALRAVPTPDMLARTVPPNEDRDGRPARSVTSALAAVTGPLRQTAAGIWTLGRPFESLSDVYLRSVGLAAHWRMFSVPPTLHQYVRLRYYVARRDASSRLADWTADELITPAHREDRVRLLQSYRDSSADKAIMVALDQFYRRRRPVFAGGAPQTRDLPDDVAPVVRYFSRSFSRRHLTADERVVRAEFWYGTAPVPAPGKVDEPGRREARLTVLRPYFEGPVENRSPVLQYPPYHALDRQGEIAWVLEYFEER